jgi:hypothetical protein
MEAMDLQDMEGRWRAWGSTLGYGLWYNTRYWENTHARHLQWWIDNPDMWVDPNGLAGNDPNCAWSPEEAFQDYQTTHQPLNNYTDQSEYQLEMSLGGPFLMDNLFFFASGKYRSMPPVTGNSFRNTGTWTDATLKLTYVMNSE